MIAAYCLKAMPCFKLKSNEVIQDRNVWLVDDSCCCVAAGTLV